MRNLVYACRAVFRWRGNNLIKIVSLTLGLAVGVMLFSRVAFEQSFDNFYPDGDRIYQIIVKSIINKETDEYDMIYEPLTRAIAEDFAEVESATHIYRAWTSAYYIGEQSYNMNTVYADSLFFDVLDFGVVRGDPKVSLGTKGNVFISERYAERMFEDKDPVGQMIMLERNEPLTVCGVFRDVPENSHIVMDAVISFSTLSSSMGMSWDGGDSFRGYFKFHDPASVPDVEARLMDALQRHHDYKADAAEGYDLKYFFRPITEVYTSDSTVRLMSIMLSLLAFVIIFMSAMNYVLLSLSSLATRAKEVGVHKCNGASSWTIFKIFLYETGIYVVGALLLVALVLWALQPDIEEAVDVTFASMFSLGNLWAVLTVVGVLFVVSGVIPAKIFSSIGVSQIFRRYTENKRMWKRALLFVQFMGAAFMLSLLIVIVRQYDTMVGKDLGYNTENLTYAEVTAPTPEKLEMVRREIAAMPEVIGVTISSDIPIYGLGGAMIQDLETKNSLFSSRWIMVDAEYLKVMDIPLVAGRNFVQGDSSLLVNEKFVELMLWEDNPVGKLINIGSKLYPVAGVVADFQLGSLYNTQQPLTIVKMPTARHRATMTIRFKEATVETLKVVNDRFDALLPESDAVRLTTFDQAIRNQYHAAMLFRNGVMLASIILLLITTMGVIGYVATEVKRRSREIAIRKVTGATAADVILMLTRNIGLLTIVAAAVGAAGAYFAGEAWVEQFAVRAPMVWWVFALGCGFVLVLVAAATVVQTWRIANENPVNSIKSE